MLRLLVFLSVVLLELPNGCVSCRAEDVAVETEEVVADLLIVGGTESGCAAAVQAARMGVSRIVVVSDTHLLGGQFTAEGLLAIDENRGPEGYGHGVPFPRHGLFRDLIERIEAINVRREGKARPGNTRVITTCRPSVSQEAFTALLRPYLDSGRVQVRTDWHPQSCLFGYEEASERRQVTGVQFGRSGDTATLTVQARLTIDASDWGDIVSRSGNEYFFGPDLQQEFGEPLAPKSRAEYPLTDLNPVTWCMVLEWQDQPSTIARPVGYDAENYRNHGYPDEPRWIYESRRLVDRTDPQVHGQDAVLLCFPAFDYPLDQHPAGLAVALEATEVGAAGKNVVQLSQQQRELIWEDAKQRSLGFLYYMQTEGGQKYPEQAELFRHLRLTDDFGTADQLPPKPYIRESLHTRTMYVMRQQDSTGFLNRANWYAQQMYHDGVGCWQFEYDFHPTKRQFRNSDSSGPWRAVFRPGRTWGPPYSGRSLLSARALIPETTDGLLVGQKNLGYTSIVSSALRLHDQSMMVGQAVGAVAAVSLLQQKAPRELPFDRRLMDQVWRGLVQRTEGGSSGMLWPFADLAPEHAAFAAVQMLAAHRVLPVGPRDVEFRANEAAESEWVAALLQRAGEEYVFPEGRELPSIPATLQTRGEVANWCWQQFQTIPLRDWALSDDAADYDLDGIPNVDDALPLSEGRGTWFGSFGALPQEDGVPPDIAGVVAAINFAAAGTEVPDGWIMDTGRPWDDSRGRGWGRDISGSNRRRQAMNSGLLDTFLFTRSHDVFELAVDHGRYSVMFCIGDSEHEQFGQNVAVEGVRVVDDVTTAMFAEYETEVDVQDGRLTIEIGRPGETTNTCLLWCVVRELQQ